MKKVGLLVVGAFLMASCDSTPSGNKAILPVVHDDAVEVVDETAVDNASTDTTLDATQVDVAEENAATRKLEEDRATEEAQAELDQQ